MFVVAGATGNTGKVVAETLLEQKQPVRVLVRDAQKGEAWKARGAEVVVGSIEEPGALARALEGAKGAYMLLPPPAAQATGILATQAKRADAWVEALGKASVPHVVLLSSVGAQHEAGTGPIRSVYDAEQKLDRLGVARTFVRAAYFMENWGGVLHPVLTAGVLPTPLTAGRKIAQVATHDIGKVAARALLDGPRGRRIIELAGPEELSPEDAARTFSALVGKTITVAPIPYEAFVPAMMNVGLGKELAELLIEMQRGVNDGVVAFEGEGAEAVRGSTPLRSVIEGLLARARA
jgi:uncharacterized protein YbjT (DUF2867 family)